MFTIPTPLPDDPAALQLILRAAVAEIERLNEMIAGLRRHRFGRKSERLSVDERDRLDQELDDISQRLTLVGFALEEVEQLLPAASDVLEDKLRTLRGQVNSITRDVHRISYNLHPSTLIDLGLAPALRGLCREFGDQTHIAVHFTGDVAVVKTSQDVTITLYRIAQECLANIARHSGSREARVALVERSGALYLTISDSGVGFEAQRLQTQNGLCGPPKVG